MDIITTSNFNASSVRAPGVYIVEKPDAGFRANSPTDIIGYVGTADWGPMNVPTKVYSPESRAAIFGAFNAKAETDKYDLANAMDIGFTQTAEGGAIEQFAVRIGDGTEAKGQITLVDTTAVTPLEVADVVALFNGDASVKVTLATGTVTNTVTATITGPAGTAVEVYPNLPSVGAGVFSGNFASAINNGTALRPPSSLVRVVDANILAIAPALGTFTLTGGNSGRTGVDYADLLGTDGTPKTGAYALRSLDPKINFLVLAGMDVSTSYSSLKTLAESEGFIVFFDFPRGTSSATAMTNKKGYGVDSPHVVFCLYHVQIYDSVNKKTRFVPPSYVIAARIASLQINESPGNKQIFNILGTERDDLTAQNVPWSTGEIGDLTEAGIMFVKKGIPRNANMFGIRHGHHSLANTELTNVAHTRIKVWLENLIDSVFGQFVDEIQTLADDDPTRAAIEATGVRELQQAKTDRIIDTYEFICDSTNNKPPTIRRGFTFFDAVVEPIGHSEKVIARLAYQRNAAVGQNALNGQTLN